jgi:Polyketide cyclase / dehydrase and lipid transport
VNEIKGREEIEINAPPEDVYAFRLDCANLPQLNPAVRNVRRVDAGAGPPSAGTRYACDVDLHWGACVATVEIAEAVRPSLIVLDMETVRRGAMDDPRHCVRSHEIARFSATSNGGTRLEVELTLFAAAGTSPEELAAMEANVGAPINVELAAMKLALENRPERVDERNEQT